MQNLDTECSKNMMLFLIAGNSEVGIYKKNQESKNNRKKTHSRPRKRPRKRSRKKESFYMKRYQSILLSTTYNSFCHLSIRPNWIYSFSWSLSFILEYYFLGRELVFFLYFLTVIVFSWSKICSFFFTILISFINSHLRIQHEIFCLL